ncbi:MAG TPA: hypothetical protein VGH36_13995 [Acetobacteraceae bacterium]|jgi:hypothetical protein
MKTTFFVLAAALSLGATAPAFAAKGAGAPNSQPKSFYSNTYSRPQTLSQNSYADRERVSTNHPDLAAIRQEDGK